jgi:hypothetical protein
MYDVGCWLKASEFFIWMMRSLLFLILNLSRVISSAGTESIVILSKKET